MNDAIIEWGIRLMSPIILFIWEKMKKCSNAAFKVLRKKKECRDAAFRVMILFVIMRVFWYFGASTITLLGVAVIAYFIVNLMFVLANYKREQLEKKKLFEQKEQFEQKRLFEQKKIRATKRSGMRDI
ncbi:hypothetical protein [Bartonella taylorii]|uniref:hypothetical protein n=1 Tax=Bartonella taylorii TaxID=33046 RepID=UPI001ABAA506|nr:hypothetical protein [Bartonella taylorii]